MGSGSRSSGSIATGVTAFSGRCKLVSVHVANAHGSNTHIVTVYDNTAASGKVVALLICPAQDCREADMHSVICDTGLHVTHAGGTGTVTLEIA